VNARLFFALWPDAAAKGALARAAREASEVCGGRAIPQPDIHLTLVFLGETDAGLIPDLSAAARSVRAAPIALWFTRLSYWKHNHIVWAGASAAPGLEALVLTLQDLVEPLGFRLERRPFVAHLTLVRNARQPPPPTAIDVRWTSTEFALVQSEGGAGARYRTLARWPLVP
jgi:RNA 2',3'-cyclic 3'-phosphodiesterase